MLRRPASGTPFVADPPSSETIATTLSATASSFPVSAGIVISVTPKAFGAGVSVAALLDRFGDLLPHLGLKQRAVRIFAFVSEDEIETDADVYKHENHECNADPDTHFAALLWKVGWRW